jgi:FolB domain-containing protein
VFYQVGVPEAERRHRQPLWLTVELELDARPAAAADDLSLTVDYGALSRRLLAYGEERSWRLIESLAEELAAWLLAEYPVQAAGVTVTKRAVSRARAVALRVRRVREGKAT